MTGQVLARASGPIDAVVTVPGSKSIANRALVCAALSDGHSELFGIPDGDDTSAMVDGLQRLGFTVTRGDRSAVVDGAGRAFAGGARIDAHLAGTTSRFLTAVAALSSNASTIDGGAALRRRPMGILHEALRALGADVECLGESDRLPVRVGRGQLRGGRIALDGATSSQFVTALMLIGPLLDDGLTIEITSPLVSRPYVDMTAAVMSSFGVMGTSVAESLINVEPSSYRAVSYAIEPDASSASYPLAAAAVVGGRVVIPGLGRGSLQGDAVFATLLGRMGCMVEVGSDRVEVRGGSSLRGIDIDMSDISDLVPTLAAVAAFAESPTTIDGVGFIRHKESDRLSDLAAGLRRIGCGVDVLPDGLRIIPGNVSSYEGAPLEVHHDHRLAMAWSLLALRVPGISVDDPAVVAKSWPAWWDVRQDLLRSGQR